MIIKDSAGLVIEAEHASYTYDANKFTPGSSDSIPWLGGFSVNPSYCRVRGYTRFVLARNEDYVFVICWGKIRTNVLGEWEEFVA